MADNNNNNYRDTKKYVSVHDSGILRELNGIAGPILNPVWMSLELIERLIINRRDVREHDVKEPQRYVKLNRRNFDDLNIYPGNSEIIDPSIADNTFILTLEDYQGDKTMVPGKLYVSLIE